MKGRRIKIYDNTLIAVDVFIFYKYIVQSEHVCLRQHENTGANTESKDKTTANSYLKKEHIIIPRLVDFMYKQTHNRQEGIGSTVSLH